MKMVKYNADGVIESDGGIEEVKKSELMGSTTSLIELDTLSCSYDYTGTGSFNVLLFMWKSSSLIEKIRISWGLVESLNFSENVLYFPYLVFLSILYEIKEDKKYD